MRAIIGHASKAEAEALYNYGWQLCMAFQVADDYLDVYGNQKVFGKPIGGDIIQNKKSWMITRALEKAEDKDAVFSAMALPVDTEEQRAAKIAAVKEIYSALGVDADAKEEILRFSDLAMDAVDGIGLSHVQTEALRRFAEKLIGRAK